MLDFRREKYHAIVIELLRVGSMGVRGRLVVVL